MRSLIPGILVLIPMLLSPSPAGAHGGVPVSLTIVRRADRLLVPTAYWGVFFGRDATDGGGPWYWICEEAINQQQARKWALADDGTFHVTDFLGITSSRDGGCTWIASTGEIAKRAPAGLVADPVDGKRAWATTAQGMDVPWNALFVTRDDGLTWSPTLQGDEYFRGPAISRDGQTLYVVGQARAPGSQALTLHASRDGGMSFSGVPIAFSLDGKPQLELEPLAVDPKDAASVYLAVRGDVTQVLLKATGQGAQLVEQFRAGAAIGGVVFDERRDAVLAPLTPLNFQPLAAGLMRSVAGAPFAPFSDLSRAQCLVPDGANGERLYACSSNFEPDSKAVARSDDGGAHFTKVFQYAETDGPTLNCPPSTPVAQMCPLIWAMYWQPAQNPDLGGEGGRPDAAAPVAPPPAGCSCGIAGRRSDTSVPTQALLMLAGAMVRLLRRFGRGTRGLRGDAVLVDMGP